MAQLPEGFVPDQMPEGFVPDGFVPDEPEPLIEETISTEPIAVPKKRGFWDMATTSLLPEGKTADITGEAETFAGGFAQGIGDYIYDEIVRPAASPLGIAASIFGAPIARGVMRVAGRIPGADTVGKILNKNVFSGADEAAAAVIPESPVSLPDVKVNPVEGGLTRQSAVERMPGGPNEGMFGIKTNDPMFPSVPNRMQGPGTNSTVFDALLPSRTKELIGQKVPLVDKTVSASDGTLRPVDNPVVRMDAATGTPLPGPIDKLVDAVRNAKKLEGEQAAIYTAEKAQKAAKVKGVKTEGQQGFFDRLGALKGEHTKVQMEPLAIDQNDINALFDDIHISGLDTFAEINASKGLQKMLDGRVPQASELTLIKKVFGAEKIDELEKLLPEVDRRKSMLKEGINIPRGMQTILDLSFPFRQGLGSITTKAWWNSWDDMIKSFGSEKAYRSVIDDVMSHENFKPMIDAAGKKQPPLFKQAGLRITDLTDATRADGELASSLVEKYVPGAKASNRAYTAFANKLRADNFNRLIASAEKAGKNPKENIEIARQIAGMINNTTGAGNLGPFEKHAAALSDLLFSPRFIASRLQMVNPANYIKTDPMVRTEYLRSLLGLTAAWGGSLELAKLAGAEVGSDPNSTDFGKAKFGETRLDPGGGFQQWLVLASRLANGEYATTTGREREFGKGFGSKTKFDALTDFIINKLAPAPAFAARIARANEYRPFELADESTKLFTPMVIQDMSDVLQNDPNLLPLMFPSLVGYGVQVQGERGTQRLFGNDIPDLAITGSEGLDNFFSSGDQFSRKIRR